MLLGTVSTRSSDGRSINSEEVATGRTIESGDVMHSSLDGRFKARGELLDRTTHRIKIYHGESGRKLMFKDAVDLWRDDPLFGEYFSSLMAASPFEAFYWECPPTNEFLSKTTPFEYVTVESHGFYPADPYDFQEYLVCNGGKDSDVVSFPNLGGDAMLVAPCERGSRDTYGHIASFVRSAPMAQKQALWAEVGRTIQMTFAQRGAAFTWVNTEGSGVPWLHVRQDSRPKYYHTREYKAPPGELRYG